MNWFWIIGLGLFAAAAGGLFLAFRNPQFVAGIAAVMAKEAWKQIKPKFKPKDFTPEQFDRIRRGENPFHDKGKK